MPELGEKGLYLYKVMPNKQEYTLDQKIFDLISLASAPGIGSSNSIYRRIQRRIEFEKGHSRRKAEKLRQFRMNSFDEHIFNASQQNKGILTQKTIDEYARDAFASDEDRNNFLDYTKMRLGYLAYLGLLNDTTEGNRFYEEKINYTDSDSSIKHTLKVRIRLNYRYEVNNYFYKFYQEYLKQKLEEYKNNFNFSSVHKFILEFCRNNEFSLEAYRQYLGKKLSGKAIEREMCWKRSSLEKLTRVGYFTKVDENTYLLTEKGLQKLEEIREADRVRKNRRYKLEKEKVLKEFVPGKGYRHLLEFAKDGILDYSDVEKRLARYNSEIRERETNIKKAMLNKLVAAGYLDPLDGEAITLDNQKPQYETGLFRLTQKAIAFLGGDYKPQMQKGRKAVPSHRAFQEVLQVIRCRNDPGFSCLYHRRLPDRLQIFHKLILESLIHPVSTLSHKLRGVLRNELSIFSQQALYRKVFQAFLRQ
ncbi:MAG: hypothetical protein QHH06_14470 [Clostridiales bacterium]|jgi:hypothetical protein|nr:hypothetical protein [Eubacteriales bacterium]MDH7567648.1 hypothetical protein [Clostridiales bacterium]